MCKRYLLGMLSPKENYQVDNRLLENDFYFEAMDGLEQVPWQQSEKHLEETESRIIQEFSIGKDRAAKKNIAWAGLGLFIASLLGIWYITSSPGPIDLSQPKNEGPAANHQELGKELEEKSDKESEISPSPAIPLPDTTTIETKQTQKTTPSPNDVRKKPKVNRKTDTANAAAIHFTVGRVVDTKGLAIPYAVVTSGSASDTTDVSGYFALKVAKGGVQLLVTHLGIPYQEVEIDTNQNWQITLDVANQTLIDYRPINAANRFK